MDKKVETNIYAVKGICVLLVIIYHYSVYYQNNIYNFSFGWFNFAYLTFAVPVFFVFSALFLYSKAKQMQNPIKLILYRMIRLYPMYWIAVLFSASVILLNGEKITGWQIIANLTMVGNVFGVESIDGAYWTMFYELMLLLVFSAASIVTVRKTKLIMRPYAFCGAWLILGAIAATAMKILGIDSSTVAILLLACRYVPVFVTGVILADRYRNYGDKGPDKRFYIMLVLCVIYQILLAADSYQSAYGLVAIAVSYAVVSGKLKGIKLLSNKLLVAIGRAGYCIYLCHNQFGRVMISRLGGVILNSHIITIFVVCLIGIAAIGIGFLLAKVERRISKGLQKMSSRVLT